MSTLTEIEAAVDSLPVAQQKKLFTVLKKRFASAPRAKNTGGKLKSASRPGIKGLGPLTEEGSGLLITAIAGGALVVVQGWLADNYGLQNSFWLTVACELYVLWYALWGCKPKAAA